MRGVAKRERRRLGAGASTRSGLMLSLCACTQFPPPPSTFNTHTEHEPPPCLAGARGHPMRRLPLPAAEESEAWSTRRSVGARLDMPNLCDFLAQDRFSDRVFKVPLSLPAYTSHKNHTHTHIHTHTHTLTVTAFLRCLSPCLSCVPVGRIYPCKSHLSGTGRVPMEMKKIRAATCSNECEKQTATGQKTDGRRCRIRTWRAGVSRQAARKLGPLQQSLALHSPRVPHDLEG